MKLWVDDTRDPPDDTWTIARTSAEAIALLSSGEPVENMQLDHDLGGDDTTRRVVLWLCEHGGWPAHITVHSDNPPGREWLIGMIGRYRPD